MTRLTGLRIFIFQLEGVRQLSQLATINPWQQLGPFYWTKTRCCDPKSRQTAYWSVQHMATVTGRESRALTNFPADRNSPDPVGRLAAVRKSMKR